MCQRVNSSNLTDVLAGDEAFVGRISTGFASGEYPCLWDAAQRLRVDSSGMAEVQLPGWGVAGCVNQASVAAEQ